MRKKYKVLLSAAALIVTIALLSFSSRRDFQIVRYLDIFHSAFKEINYWYVDDTDPQEMIEGAIKGMLKTLDPYTSYIPSEEKKDFDFLTTGQYGGIGSLIRKSSNGYAVVSEPYKGFPADRAELKAGDMIIKIDNESVAELDIKEVSNLLRGTPKSKVLITLVKPVSFDTLEVEIVREEISISSISYAEMLNDTIAYVLLSKFTQNAGTELRSTLKKLQDNHKVKSIIIDLRNNSGGLLDEAIEIANVFIPKGELVVKTKGQISQFNQQYKTTKEVLNDTLPLVVLVNRSSASASEIVAGCMQDLDRGVIVGERTFGKGLVQSTRPLNYDAQIKITTAKYYIPSGRCIQSLDFSHKNLKGKYDNIPDSLISEFQTRGGRTVYDGGGIKPDISIEAEQMADISVSLHTNYLIFDFATNFYYSHDSIPAISDFYITDEIWEDFVLFLENKDYEYSTAIEKKYNDLISSAKQENIFSHLENALEKLDEEIQKYKKNDIEIHQEQIRQLLKEEIVKRYYYEKGAIEATLMSDPQLEKALYVLKDKDVYDSTLKPVSK
jgi:carboxyl-terminal processing protease